jgi:ABC-type Fe3+ transport system substrate-binding protein
MSRLSHRYVGWTAALWLGFALMGNSPARAADDALVAAAKQEKEVVWYTVQTMTQLVLPLVDAFQAKYGVKVSYVRADSSEIALRIENEAKGGRVLDDVFDGTGTLPPLKRSNLVLAWVPDFTRAWPQELTDPQAYWVATNYLVNTVAINTELVPPAAEPHQWSDLLDPKWRGKMAWGSLPSFSAGPGFIALILKDYGEEKGSAYLAALAKQDIAGIPVSARQVLDQVIAGEYAIGINVFNIHVVSSAGHGAPVEWLPFSPSLVTVNTVSVMKDAPHPNAAKLFVDFMTSEEGQAIFRDNDYLPTNPQVKPRVPNLIPDGKLFRGVFLSQDEIDAGMPGWMKLFGEFFH